MGTHKVGKGTSGAGAGVAALLLHGMLATCSCLRASSRLSQGMGLGPELPAIVLQEQTEALDLPPL